MKHGQKHAALVQKAAAIKLAADQAAKLRRKWNNRIDSRRLYRQQHPQRRSADWSVPNAVLADVTGYGNRRWVTGPDGVQFQAVCYDKRELSQATGRTLTLLHRWMRTGRFPKPRFVAMGSRHRKVGVYLDYQVEAILAAYTHHLRYVADHYRLEHEDLRKAFFAAVSPLRVFPRG
jgi:hypothetical protein